MEELRFDDAQALVDAVDGPARATMAAELDRRRDVATTEARELADGIAGAAYREDYRRLTVIAGAPRTDRLLALLPDATVRRSRAQLQEGAAWKASRQRLNRNRLEEARAALTHLDVQMAAGIMARIDSEFLGPDERDLQDQLLLEIEARTMELETLTDVAAQAVAEHQPAKRRRRWFGR